MRRTPWLFWPVSLAVMSRIGRYLLYEVAVPARIAGRYDPYWPLFVALLARIADRYEPYWPLFAVWRGCSGPYRWPL